MNTIMTDVTIRGIDDEVYALFSAEARKKNVPIGDLVSQVMRIYLEETTDLGYVIEGVVELVITKGQLESVGEPISFLGIKNIVIDESVDYDVFKKYVDEIRRCKTLTVPKTLTKFQVLTRCKNVSKIIEK